MVIMANNKTIEVLNLKLTEARAKLDRAEDALVEAENEVFKIKETITDVLIKLETESLPTGLYNKGYKLQEKEHQFILSDRFGEEVCTFNHVPTLGDLMDLEYQINFR